MKRSSSTSYLAGVLAAGVAIAGAGAGPVRGEGLPPDDADLGIVVKLDTGSDLRVADLAEEHPVELDQPLLGSRGIYRLLPTDPETAGDESRTAKLAKKIAKVDDVVYAEPDYATKLADRRYHNWAAGDPTDAGTDEGAWLDQDVSHALGLTDAHQRSTGESVVVAVLDTGVEATHPALAGRLLAGYDYVDDDAKPDETVEGSDQNGNGVVDEGYGHGTAVAGTVALVAPDALILPLRVLDSDGTGSVFVVAEAIADAVDQGADVINISLGTAKDIDSDLVEDMLKQAEKAEVVVVAAAGNSGNDDKQHPADDKNVLSVTASTTDSSALAPFSSWGDWVALAAPAERVMGPAPGGGYSWWAGTSLAAPQVSGVVALVAAARVSRIARTGSKR